MSKNYIPQKQDLVWLDFAHQLVGKFKNDVLLLLFPVRLMLGRLGLLLFVPLPMGRKNYSLLGSF
ncbi:hypothetical protein SMU50_09546 [Streptococcus mutans 5SM3]|nr:hypothetical protein SMU50_09546 [Streptococcus mutans 5SM3]EMC47212.1 hypothetical protein SMU102_09813 [Streptococcus mutans S1B]